MLSDIYFAPGLLQPVQREKKGDPKNPPTVHSPQPNKWTNAYTSIHVYCITLSCKHGTYCTLQKLCNEPILTGSRSDFSKHLNTDLCNYKKL